MSDKTPAEKPFKMFSYVARQFLGLTQAQWNELGEEDQKKYVKAARRALTSADKFKERLADQAA